MDGYLHKDNPAGTTHVKLFHTSMMCQRNSAMAHGKASGYFNTTNAINAVKFQLSSETFSARNYFYVWIKFKKRRKKCQDIII